LRCSNQLQQFLWVIQHLFEGILLVAQRRRSDLRCHAGVFQADVRRHEAHFVDADSFGISNGGLKLLREFRRL
jgi:hypothetical protein